MLCSRPLAQYGKGKICKGAIMITKPTLLFIHGMWSRPRVWDPMRAHFEAQGYKTLAPALPGHDVTPADPVPIDLPSYGLPDYVQALEAAAWDIDGPVVVVGHSMGSLLAQLLSVRIQPAGLVLLSTAPSADVVALGVEPFKASWPVIRKWGFWREATLLPRSASLYGVYNGVPDDIAQAETDELIHDSGRVLAQIILGALYSGAPSRVDYSRLTCPSLVVVGTQDRITPVGVSRSTARKLAGSVQYREIDNAGHWLFHDPIQGRVLEMMDAFLNRFC